MLLLERRADALGRRLRVDVGIGEEITISYKNIKNLSEDCTVDYQPVRRSGRGIVGIHEIPGTEIYNAFKRGERLAHGYRD